MTDPLNYSLRDVKLEASKELAEEHFRGLVEQEKERLRSIKNRSFWARIFPWRIQIVRKDK